jgi:ArsR family transcriptional regulator
MVASSPLHLQASQVFHALSDATRLELIQRLAGGEHCVCDLTDALKAGQSRLSFHLKVLKDAGLIRDRREGRWMYYTLNEEAFEEAEGLIRMLKNGDSVTRTAKRRC